MKKHSFKIRLNRTKGTRPFGCHLDRFMSCEGILTLYAFIAFNVPNRFGFMVTVSYESPFESWELKPFPKERNA